MIRYDESDAAAPFLGYKDSPIPMGNLGNINDKNEDTISSSEHKFFPLNVQEVNNNVGNRSIVTLDTQSLQTIEMHGPLPISPEDNSRLTSQYICKVLSIIYAVFLVTLGLIIYSSSSFNKTGNTNMIYSICLYVIGFASIIYFMIDISRYKCIALKNQRIKQLHEETGLTSPKSPCDDSLEVCRPSKSSPAFTPLKHLYCFSKGRHAESFYLKLGATCFAIGHLVHSMIQLTVQLGYLFDEEVKNDNCYNVLAIVLDVMIPCYCILQLYFMFKYSNIIILRLQGLAHFIFMHMIGSSLCFWISAIVRDSTMTLTIYAYAVYGKGSTSYSNEQIAQKLGSVIDIQGLYKKNCSNSAVINTIMSNFPQYLYPFTVEFNILIVAVYFIIWSNIGNYENYTNTSFETSSTRAGLPCKPYNENEEDDLDSNIVIYADCSRSFRGLFAGIILLVLVIGNIIIGFVLGTVGGQMQKAGYVLKDVVKLSIHSSMLIASIVAFNQLKRLDINRHPMSLLDDVLLFICLPAFFMETVLSFIATVNIVNVLKSIDVIVMVLQVVIQTPLIMDGLRRCSNSKKLRRSKPGRELLMFLLIANVSMWLFNTFSYKSPESIDERYEFYGKVLWTVLGHISLPLIMFYRFHSSVCFADIWDSAYKPSEDQ